MEVKPLGLALAASRDVPPAERLAIGTVIEHRERDLRPDDWAMTMIDALAYLGDLLSYYQDRVADEAYLEATYDRDEDVVRIRLLADLRPVLFIVADEQHAYVITVGEATEESTVRFGEGKRGQRPPRGLEDVAARYGRGTGRTGNLELCGLRLREPLFVLAISHPGSRTRCSCSSVGA
jgi:hypothetical protein